MDGKERPATPTREEELAARRRRVQAAKKEGKNVRAIAESEGVSLGTVVNDLTAKDEGCEACALVEYDFDNEVRKLVSCLDHFRDGLPEDFRSDFPRIVAEAVKRIEARAHEETQS